jgi:hypothetical protein
MMPFHRHAVPINQPQTSHAKIIPVLMQLTNLGLLKFWNPQIFFFLLQENQSK